MADQRKVATPATDDRLSSLPDEIITHILSFFETKYAVRTTVLSRRWKDLWIRVPNLDFDFGNWARKHGFAEHQKEVIRVLRFSRSVNKVLSKHKSLHSLRHFRLHFTPPRRYKGKVRLDCGVCRVLEFGSQVEEIDVSIDMKLPESFYTLKNLKVVKLEGVTMTAMGSVSLPSLKVLELQRVVTKDFESLGRLISGCPVLETLSLVSLLLRRLHENDMLTAYLPSLRNLTIIDVLDVDVDVDDDDDDEPDMSLCHIAMEAPHLEHLYLGNFTGLQLLGSSPLPCLYSAKLDVKEGSKEGLIRLLTQISNAKKMRFDRNALKILSSGDEHVKLPAFPNLTHLEVKPSRGSWILHSLLHSAPKLQSLVINCYCYPYGPFMWEETEPTCTPECLLSSLEEIKFTGFVPHQTDMKMVGYLLNAGAVLKKVSIHAVSSNYVECKELASLLEKLPRGSSAYDIRVLFQGSEIDNI